MRHLLLLVLAAAILSTGCNKPAQGPKTTELAVPMRPMDALAPEESAPAETWQEVEPAEPAMVPVTEYARPQPTESFYIVQKGDTYYSIARTVLGDQRRWKEIQALNPDVQPTKIKVGQKLRMPVN